MLLIQVVPEDIFHKLQIIRRGGLKWLLISGVIKNRNHKTDPEHRSTPGG